MNRARAAEQAIARLDQAIASLAPAAVELRFATTATVANTGRLIRVVAVPYEQPTNIMYRNRAWREVFSRGAFSGQQPDRVRVNRDHDRTRTVGKVTELDTTNPNGLIAEIRIAATLLGDETLALAAEDCLSASIGFKVGPTGQKLDQHNMLRRITAAQIDHIALTADPAYTTADVIGVK